MGRGAPGRIAVDSSPMSGRSLRRAGVSFVLALLALAGARAGWHDHPLEVDELSSHLVSHVEHAGGPGHSAHIDSGDSVLRPACWACVLRSSPPEASARAVALYSDPDSRGAVATLPGDRVSGRRATPTPARGPPPGLSKLFA